MAKTTINMKKDLFVSLGEISEQLKVTKSALVRRILMYTHENLDFNKYYGDLTRYQRYQKRIPGNEWKCFHVNYSELESDVFLLCRFHFRISLSKLLFIGFCLFIEEVIDSFNDEKEEVKIKSKYSYTSFFNKYTEIVRKEMCIFQKEVKTRTKT